MNNNISGTQKPIISNKQISNMKIGEEIEDGVGSNNANLDINSILSQVLGGFNNASLGATEISGGLIFPVVE